METRDLQLEEEGGLAYEVGNCFGWSIVGELEEEPSGRIQCSADWLDCLVDVYIGAMDLGSKIDPTG